MYGTNELVTYIYVGIQQMYTEEQRSMQCWIGITRICVAVLVISHNSVNILEVNLYNCALSCSYEHFNKFRLVLFHNSILSNLILFSPVGFVYNTFISVAFGIPGDPKAAAEGEKLLVASLAKIESFWLQGGDGPFLLGNSKPTIADLALVCEITQLEASKQNMLTMHFL